MKRRSLQSRVALGVETKRPKEKGPTDAPPPPKLSYKVTIHTSPGHARCARLELFVLGSAP